MPATTVAVAQSLIDRYLDGTSMQDLATEHGVTRPRLYQILLAKAPEDWRQAQVAHAVERLEEAKRGIDAATDALMLARARESARIAEWELERLLHRLYGQKQELTGKDGGPIQVQVMRVGATYDAAPQDAQVVESKGDATHHAKLPPA